MGGIFRAFSPPPIQPPQVPAPVILPAPPPPPPPPPAPVQVIEAPAAPTPGPNTAEVEAKTRLDQLDRQRRGRVGLIATSDRGLLSQPAAAGAKRLLGE